LTEDSRKAGRKTRTEVLGTGYVAKSDANRNAFNADFLDFITEGAWGSVWSRPGLTRRERSLITIALLAALGHDEEVAMHVRATANTGATAGDIKEALLHVAVYAGVPAANRAVKIAGRTLEEMGREDVTKKAKEGTS
jgi:4-carboxymuconolactone decarboxylase